MGKMFKFEIYQLPSGNQLSFMPWFWVKDKFSFADYEMVYDANVTVDNQEYLLDSLFSKFNINRPEDFTGHSLSVSDIIKVYGYGENGEDEYYFCDAMGWQKVEV